MSVAQEQISDLINVGGEKLLVVSHGLQNDRGILLDNGVDLYSDKNEEAIEGICTYKMAERVLNRPNKLTLQDVAGEAGFYLSNGHNAYHDAFATVAAFSFLLKIQEDKSNEQKNV